MAPPESSKIDRQTTTPFLLKLFYRTGAYQPLEDFTPRAPLPQHLQIYTWQSCSLRELTYLLTSALPNLLPTPSIGTRLAFRLVFPDTRDSSRAGPPRFLCKELGGVIVGEGGPGIELDDDQANGNGDRVDELGRSEKKASSSLPLTGDADKTLQDAQFVIGDYVSVAVVPPMADGSVGAPLPASSSSAAGSGYGMGRGGLPSRQNGFGDGYGSRRGGGGPRYDSGPRGGDRGMPSGDWRRGERPPDSYAPGGGYGRGRGRPRPY